MIARTRQLVIRTRNFPAAEMLRTRRQAQDFGGLRGERDHPLRETLGLQQFVRLGPAVDEFAVGVGRIQFIEAPDGLAEARGFRNTGEEQVVKTHARDDSGRSGAEQCRPPVGSVPIW